MSTGKTTKNKKFIRSLSGADKRFLTEANSRGFSPVISGQQITEICNDNGWSKPYWMLNETANRVARGVYYLPDLEGYIDLDEIARLKAARTGRESSDTKEEQENELIFIFDGEIDPSELTEFVPRIDPNYIGWGINYKKIQIILTSQMWMPIYLTGLSGNGKTTMIEQICATNKREYLRVNINELTDEDDLIGGFRLVNGETVWHDGPVTVAAKRGAVLLLDEIDLASMKIMCLQPVLEGKPFFIKKTNTWVYPTKGFTVVATGNTKGLGDDSGNFIGTNFLNEAMMDRFDLTYTQQYPSSKVETKILETLFKNNGKTPEVPFITALVDWANDNRKTYENQGISRVITTRRLVTIVRHFMVFADMKDAVADAVERFDGATKDSLVQLFDKYIPKPEIPDIGAGAKKKDGEIDYENDSSHDILRKLGVPKDQYEKLPEDL